MTNKPGSSASSAFSLLDIISETLSSDTTLSSNTADDDRGSVIFVISSSEIVGEGDEGSGASPATGSFAGSGPPTDEEVIQGDSRGAEDNVTHQSEAPVVPTERMERHRAGNVADDERDGIGGKEDARSPAAEYLSDEAQRPEQSTHPGNGIGRGMMTGTVMPEEATMATEAGAVRSRRPETDEDDHKPSADAEKVSPNLLKTDVVDDSECAEMRLQQEHHPCEAAKAGETPLDHPRCSTSTENEVIEKGATNDCETPIEHPPCMSMENELIERKRSCISKLESECDVVETTRKKVGQESDRITQALKEKEMNKSSMRTDKAQSDADNIGRTVDKKATRLAQKGHHQEQVSDGQKRGESSPKGDGAEQDSTPSKFGRIIMIDGIKFVAATCLRPPRGQCRTCNSYGSLLYFSARSSHLLEAAQKFCSVQCAREFINEKRSCLAVSRQPSGDVGSEVALPKLVVVQHENEHTPEAQKKSTGRCTPTKTRSRFDNSKIPSERKKKSEYRIDGAALQKFQTLCGIYEKSVALLKNNPTCAANKRGESFGGNSAKGRCSSATPLRRRRCKTYEPVLSTSATSLPSEMSENFPSIDSSKRIFKNPKPGSKSSHGNMCDATKQLLGSTAVVTDTNGDGITKSTKESKARSKSLGTLPSPIIKHIRAPSEKPNRKIIVGVQTKDQTSKFRFPPISSTMWKKRVTPHHRPSSGTSRGEARKKKTFPSSLQCDAPSMETQFSGENDGSPKSDSHKRLHESDFARNPVTSKGWQSWSTSKARELKRSSPGRKDKLNSASDTPRSSKPKQTSSPSISRRGMRETKPNGLSKKTAGVSSRLNQFHDRMRSRFKTMFPFQDSILLDDKTKTAASNTSRGEETPSETSLVDEIGDADPSSVRATKVSGLLDGTSTHPRGHGYKIAPGVQRVHKRSSKGDKGSSKDKDKSKDDWASLLKFMIEAADREDSERAGKGDECARGRIYARTVLDGAGAISEGMDAIERMRCPGEERAEDDVEKMRADDVIEKRKKKKKKKRKRKKDRRRSKSPDEDDGCTETGRVETASRHRKKKARRKRKHHQACTLESLESPTITNVDRSAWPKWTGDGKEKTDMMTGVDLLLWTMKNDFQPDVGGAPTVGGNGKNDV